MSVLFIEIPFLNKNINRAFFGTVFKTVPECINNLHNFFWSTQRYCWIFFSFSVLYSKCQPKLYIYIYIYIYSTRNPSLGECNKRPDNQANELGLHKLDSQQCPLIIIKLLHPSCVSTVNVDNARISL